MAEEVGGSAHSALCLRLMQLFPRVSRGMRRWQDRSAPSTPAPLGPRHVAALEQLRGGPVTVGELASQLGLTLPTVSGVLADLDRAGLVSRQADPADRRRNVVTLTTTGQERLTELQRHAAAVQDELLAGLDAGERQQLHTLLAKLLSSHQPQPA